MALSAVARGGACSCSGRGRDAPQPAIIIISAVTARHVGVWARGRWGRSWGHHFPGHLKAAWTCMPGCSCMPASQPSASEASSSHGTFEVVHAVSEAVAGVAHLPFHAQPHTGATPAPCTPSRPARPGRLWCRTRCGRWPPTRSSRSTSRRWRRRGRSPSRARRSCAASARSTTWACRRLPGSARYLACVCRLSVMARSVCTCAWGGGPGLLGWCVGARGWGGGAREEEAGG